MPGSGEANILPRFMTGFRPEGWRLMAAFAAIALSSAQSAPPAAAPAFTLDLTSGGQLSLDRLRGRVVVLNLWATWCAPCRGELAELDAFAAEQGNARVAVVAVLVERRPDARLLARQIAQLHLPIARGFAAGGAQYPLVNSGVPTTYVIDRAGRLAFVKAGLFRPGEIRARVGPLLEPS